MKSTPISFHEDHRSSDQYHVAIEEIASNHNISSKTAKKLELEIGYVLSQQYEGESPFNWDTYGTLLNTAADYHLALEERDSLSKILPSSRDPDMGFFRKMMHRESLRDAARIFTEPEQIIDWYIFGMRCYANEKLDAPEYSNLVKTLAGSSSTGEYYLCLDSGSKIFTDYEVSLRDSWPSILETAECGFCLIDEHTAIIQDLEERENHPELSSIEWRKLLVNATEELAKSRGIDIMLFRSADNHFLKTSYERDQANLRERFDCTAQEMGYTPERTSEGKLVFFKPLADKPFCPDIKFPRDRTEDSYLVH